MGETCIISTIIKTVTGTKIRMENSYVKMTCYFSIMVIGTNVLF